MGSSRHEYAVLLTRVGEFVFYPLGDELGRMFDRAHALGDIIIARKGPFFRSSMIAHIVFFPIRE